MELKHLLTLYKAGKLLLPKLDQGLLVSDLLKIYRKINPKAGSNERKSLGELLYNFSRSRCCWNFLNPDLGQQWELFFNFFWPDNFDKHVISATNRFLITKFSEGDLANLPPELSINCLPEFQVKLLNAYGNKIDYRTLNQPIPCDVWVNPKKNSPQILLAELQAKGIKAELCKFSPLGIRIKVKTDLKDFIKQGQMIVQSESSQLATLWNPPQSTDLVLDYCAGAGGKSIVLASFLNNPEQLFVHDSDPGRLARARERFNPLNLNRIRNFDPKQKYDYIFLDVPCSGSGTWMRNPESAWRKIDMLKLKNIQSQILEQTKNLLKVGGTFVYATCSIFPEENQEQVSNFLITNPNFVERSCFQILPWGILIKNQNFLDYSDYVLEGFFCCRLTKIREF